MLDTIVTGGEKNGIGLLCISTDAGVTIGSSTNSRSNTHNSSNSGMVLACPSVTTGQVRVELYGLRKTLFFDAHEGPLAAISLTIDGSLLATASERGTIIRLFNTGWKSGGCIRGGYGNISESSNSLGTPLREFRRGVEHAKICSLSFSLDRCWLGCASDRGTVHIFKIDDDGKKDQYYERAESKRNQPSTRKKVHSSPSATASKLAKNLLPKSLAKSTKKYLGMHGENSYAQVHGIPHPQLCAFLPDHQYTISVAGKDNHGNGCLLLANYGPETGNNSSNNRHQNTNISSYSNQNCLDSAIRGEARRVAYHRFFKSEVSNKETFKNRALYHKEQDTNLIIQDEKNSESCCLEGIDNEIIFDDYQDGFVTISKYEDNSKVSSNISTNTLTRERNPVIIKNEVESDTELQQRAKKESEDSEIT